MQRRQFRIRKTRKIPLLSNVTLDLPIVFNRTPEIFQGSSKFLNELRSRCSSEMAAPSRAEIVSLFRSLLRTAAKFPDYNIREYVRRRTIDGFREKRGLVDTSAIAEVYSDGKSQLEVAKRQAVVYSLYAPPVKSVMEIHAS